jgi:HSP20 family protein
MMSLSRWDPYRESVSLREAMNRLFDESWLGPSWSREGDGDAQGIFVPLDMVEKDDQIEITAPLPGLKAEDVDIRVTGDILTIKGEFREEKEEERGTVHHRERRYGSFQRAIRLPMSVDTSKAEATFEDGMLTLSLPKTEEAKPKQIEVKAKSKSD